MTLVNIADLESCHRRLHSRDTAHGIRLYFPPMATSDRYGLEITTSSVKAAGHFQDGMDRLLSYSAGAEESFASALAADPRLAVAHTGLALLALVQGDAATARAAAGRARESVGGATRRERQHVEALSALIAGETTRGLALTPDHTPEFPRHAGVASP